MTVSRLPRLAAGDEVEVGGSAFTVTALAAGTVALTGVTGEVTAVPAAALLTDPSFAIRGPSRPRAPLPGRGLLEGLPEQVLARAEWWEQHLLEVLTGTPPGLPDTVGDVGNGGPTSTRSAAGGGASRTRLDPGPGSLRQRELNKVAELQAAGEPVSLATFGRMRRRYQREGLLGLVDGRLIRAPVNAVDPRLRAAVERAVAAETDRSTGTVTRLRRRVEHLLRSEYGVDPAEVMPPRSSFYRLVRQLSTGRHTFGSAATRRSLAQRPDGPFGAVTVLRPGEWMHIDSTPIDVRVVLDDGTVDRAELTWMIDIATRSLPAAVLRPTTKAVDASLLLARSVTPEPMRPGWTDALRMSRSVLPHQRLVGLDERLEHAAARPVIVPETIVVDHGKVYLSAAFRAACRAMGVNVQPTHTGSPWEKGVVERSFASVATLFSQYVAGYVGRNVDRRGKNTGAEAVWSLVELQDLLDEWIVAHWQNRPHDGLRHPLTPGAAMTPNEQYAALLEIAGYVPVPLGGDDYVELLPATWRVINAYGVKINHRTYDCAALNPYRRQPSGVTAHHGQWEVHHDPYDVTRIWVRNHHDGGWITVPWTHLRSSPAPFGEQAWAQARDILVRRGHDATDEAEVAAAVIALLDRAGGGPEPASGKQEKAAAKRDRRVAARTRATSTPTGPRPTGPADTQHDAQRGAPASEDGPGTTLSGNRDPSAGDAATSTQTAGIAGATTGEPEEPSGDGLAPVIPLGVFDARDEATRWW
jgi:putative transposase